MMNKYSIPTVKQIKDDLEKGPKFEVVSLFAGGGGSSCGYRMAGGKVLAASEFIPEARNTYLANWPDVVMFPQDVRELTGAMILEAIGKGPGELDILDGSPPCSAFSVAGKREKGWGQEKAYSDSKQTAVETLFFEYIRILKEVRPKVFVAENVAGLARGVSAGFLNEFFDAFEGAGYEVRAKILDAKWLGVPQSRPRLIFVGVRSDLWRPEFEDKTHPKPFSKAIPLSKAFAGLELTDEDIAETDISRYAVYRELVKLRPGEQSKKYFNLIEGDPNRPSGCVTASCGHLSAASVCHWDDRAYTVKEIKRIVSIPDDYELTGTYQQRVERLGRMVPPLMMKAIAENIYINILTKLKEENVWA